MKTAVVLLIGLACAWSVPTVAQEKDKTKQKSAEKNERKAERYYGRGYRALDKNEWEKAAEYFEAAKQAGGPVIAGAMYWQAYALAKQAKLAEANELLSEITAAHGESGWLADAEALQLELRELSGEGVAPEMEADEELKLYAINALTRTDPERAVPLLEKILLEPGSPELKERAIFVLSMTKNAAAAAIVEKIARGAGNPDLQLKAIHYLALRRRQEAGPVLEEIYGSTNDVRILRSIIRAYAMAKDKDRILALAFGEEAPALRGEAIRALGMMNAGQELLKLFDVGSSPEEQRTVLHALGMVRTPEATEAVIRIYQQSGDNSVKRSAINALMMQRKVPELIVLAEKEDDLDLKKVIVERLSHSKSKEATEYLIQLLEK